MCSHVTAVMFKVEAAVRIGLTSAACTSEACRYLFINFLFKLLSVLVSNKEKKLRSQVVEVTCSPFSTVITLFPSLFWYYRNCHVLNFLKVE